MRPRISLFTLSLMLVLTLLAGCGARQPESALLRLLRFIPDKSEYREYVIFGDAVAWHTSWEIPRIDNLDELEELDRETRAYWMMIMGSQTMPANALGRQYLAARDDMRGYYGFDLFNVDRWIEAGAPPETITAVGFSFDSKQIGEALTDFGYDHEALDGGGTLYSILEDYEFSMDIPTRIGQLGTLNRVALLEGQMVITRATELVEDALDAKSGERRSLAENEEFRAAVLALEDDALADYGELVGAFLTDDKTLSDPLARFGTQMPEEDRERH